MRQSSLKGTVTKHIWKIGSGFPKTLGFSHIQRQTTTIGTIRGEHHPMHHHHWLFLANVNVMHGIVTPITANDGWVPPTV
jgi:hypothetical protein